MKCIYCHQFMNKASSNQDISTPIHQACYDRTFFNIQEELISKGFTLDHIKSVKGVSQIVQQYVYHLEHFGKVSEHVYVADYIRKNPMPKVRKRAPGAGRPKIGEQRRLAITLPENEWEIIDHLIPSHFKSYAEYFRHLHQCSRMNIIPVDFEGVQS